MPGPAFLVFCNGEMGHEPRRMRMLEPVEGVAGGLAGGVDVSVRRKAGERAQDLIACLHFASEDRPSLPEVCCHMMIL